jgi:hypothetical protein
VKTAPTNAVRLGGIAFVLPVHLAFARNWEISRPNVVPPARMGGKDQFGGRKKPACAGVGAGR